MNDRAKLAALFEPAGTPATNLDELTPEERVKLSNFLLLRDADLASFPSGLHLWPRVVEFCEKLVTGVATVEDVRQFASAVAGIGGIESYARTYGKCPHLADIRRNAEIEARLQTILNKLQGVAPPANEPSALTDEQLQAEIQRLKGGT